MKHIKLLSLTSLLPVAIVPAITTSCNKIQTITQEEFLKLFEKYANDFYASTFEYKLEEVTYSLNGKKIETGTQLHYSKNTWKEAWYHHINDKGRDASCKITMPSFSNIKKIISKSNTVWFGKNGDNIIFEHSTVDETQGTTTTIKYEINKYGYYLNYSAIRKNTSSGELVSTLERVFNYSKEPTA